MGLLIDVRNSTGWCNRVESFETHSRVFCNSAIETKPHYARKLLTYFVFRYIMVYPSRHHQPSHGTICEREAVLPDWFGRNMRKLTPTAQPGWRQSHVFREKPLSWEEPKKVTFVCLQKRLGRDFFVSIYSIHHYINLYHIIKEHLEVQTPFEKNCSEEITTSAQQHSIMCMFAGLVDAILL